MSQTPEVDIEHYAARRTGAVTVDVREVPEYLQAHVPGAQLLPMGQLPARTQEIDRNKPVFVICATGNRSAAMTDLLRARGYEAYSVAGGTAGWIDSGRPIEHGR